MPVRPKELKVRENDNWVTDDLANVDFSAVRALGATITDSQGIVWHRTTSSEAPHPVYETRAPGTEPQSGDRKIDWYSYDRFHCKDDRQEEYDKALGFASGAIALTVVVFAVCVYHYAHSNLHDNNNIVLFELGLLVAVAVLTGLATKHYCRGTSTDPDAGLRLPDSEVDKPTDAQVLHAREALLTAFGAGVASVVMLVLGVIRQGKTNKSEDFWFYLFISVVCTLISFLALAVALGCMDGYGGPWFDGELKTTIKQKQCQDDASCQPQREWCRWNKVDLA